MTTPREELRSERRGASGLMRWVPSDARWLGLGSVPLFVALSIQNVSNLVFHVTVSRIIGPSRYGELAALLSVVFVISVPIGVVQTIVAKRVALVRAAGDESSVSELLRNMLRTLTVLGAAAMALLVVIAPAIASFLHISWGPSALIGPYFLVSLILGLALGNLQGSLRFGALGVAVVVGVVVRLVLGIGLSAAGLRSSGGMLATVAAQLVSCVVALSLSRLSIGRSLRARFELGEFRRDFRPAFLALGTFALLSQVDLVLGRHYLEAEVAGWYSGSGLVARALLFLPGAVSIAAFPRFAELRGAGAQARRWLHLSMFAVAGLLVAAIPIVIVFRETIVLRVLGEDFRSSVALVPILAVAMGAMALVSLLTYFHVAAETFAYRFLLVGLVAQVMLIVIFHGSGRQIAGITVCVSFATMLALYFAARSVSRTHRGDLDVHARDETADPQIDVSIVLPCHNSGRTIREVLTHLSGDFLAPSTAEIILVSDGSTDDTVEIARTFGPRVQVIEQRQTGKGSALRAGLMRSRGRYVAFMDSDGDISASDIKPFLSLMALYEPDIVLGSKRHPLSIVHYPLMRRVMSWTYHKLTRLLFRVNVRDTQTGLKMIRRDVLEATLPRMLEKRFAFDLELLVVARLLGYARVFEAPVQIDYQFESSVNLRRTIEIVQDTLAIFYRRFILGTYHHEPEDPTALQALPQQPEASPAEDATTHVGAVGSPSESVFVAIREPQNDD